MEKNISTELLQCNNIVIIAYHGIIAIINQSSDDLDLQIKIVIGRSLFDLIADHFLPFF